MYTFFFHSTKMTDSAIRFLKNHYFKYQDKQCELSLFQLMISYSGFTCCEDCNVFVFETDLENVCYYHENSLECKCTLRCGHSSCQEIICKYCVQMTNDEDMDLSIYWNNDHIMYHLCAKCNKILCAECNIILCNICNKITCNECQHICKN